MLAEMHAHRVLDSSATEFFTLLATDATTWFPNGAPRSRKTPHGASKNRSSAATSSNSWPRR